jgi:hypothetical protein
MLEVEDPPKLKPWKPMSFDELYAGPIQGADDDHTDVHSPEPLKPQAKSKHMAACRNTESTSQATLASLFCLLPCHPHFILTCRF